MLREGIGDEEKTRCGGFLEYVGLSGQLSRPFRLITCFVRMSFLQ